MQSAENVPCWAIVEFCILNSEFCILNYAQASCFIAC